MEKKVKKSSFVLTGIALGLSVLTTSINVQASLPMAVDGQSLPSLAPMLQKFYPQ